ncbi:unnamed protein product [Fraxinus pennsylvanica]|uniref:Uncharacterized protein n=1 Tax=Fraxinus pennsylvanica TaxID=56036 RepID=A0AAD2DMD4_9LAMI|nr:unnamed protein product [Fraxinus pennsylvanica]
MKKVLPLAKKALVRLLGQGEMDVNIFITSRLTEIKRITAPNEPLKDDNMKDAAELQAAIFGLGEVECLLQEAAAGQREIDQFLPSKPPLNKNTSDVRNKGKYANSTKTLHHCDQINKPIDFDATKKVAEDFCCEEKGSLLKPEKDMMILHGCQFKNLLLQRVAQRKSSARAGVLSSIAKFARKPLYLDLRVLYTIVPRFLLFSSIALPTSPDLDSIF